MNATMASDEQRAAAIDDELSHVWMVRRFLKHAEETEDDEELQEIARDLYDFMLAVGPARTEGDWAAYMKMAKKKLKRLRRATELFVEIQPEVSGHTNFQMAARSLRLAVEEITAIVQT
jgi:cob(I)alamin adenosyltransferase